MGNNPMGDDPMGKDPMGVSDGKRGDSVFDVLGDSDRKRGGSESIRVVLFGEEVRRLFATAGAAVPDVDCDDGCDPVDCNPRHLSL